MSATNDLADCAFQLSTTNDDEIGSLVSSYRGSNIRVSNEPQFRLQLRELDEEGEERRFLAYAEEEKGLLESQLITSGAPEWI